MTVQCQLQHLGIQRKTNAMKIIALLSTLAACCSAFTPSSSSSKTASVTALNAEMSRMAFVSAAAASVFGVAVAQPAFAMDQENIDDPTEQWETGSPTASAKELRKTRFTAARTQNNSNYPPIKRLTLERKSPVTRLDINAPDFTAYKKTYPGLFK